MSTTPNIKEAISHGKSILSASDSSQLDSEVLLAHAIQKNRSYLRAWPEKTLSSSEQATFTNYLKQRSKGTPIAYITGEKEFWSRPFMVSPSVLIPRPDTELLIEIIQKKLQTNQNLTALDLGTGSGAIAITLALEFNNADILATDLSEQALGIAQQNANSHHTNNVKFIASNWFENVPSKRFDLIVSNPPYICENDSHLQQGDVRFEPKSALISTQQGLQDIKQITSTSHSFLKPEGFLLLEHGYEQGNDVKKLLTSSGFKHVEQFKDIQGHTRATLGQQL